MRKSIFNIEKKTTYKDEYSKIIKVLSSKCLSLDKKNYTYFEFVDTFLFNNWKYRDTFIDLYSYLDYIGVNIKNKKINENNFINFYQIVFNLNTRFIFI